MQLQQNQKQFSSFILLFLLDNIMNKSICYRDNEAFKDVMNMISRESRIKTRILKAFLSEISIDERNRYKLVRNAFFDKNYTSGHALLLTGSKEKESFLKGLMGILKKEELEELKNIIDEKLKEN